MSALVNTLGVSLPQEGEHLVGVVVMVVAGAAGVVALVVVVVMVLMLMFVLMVMLMFVFMVVVMVLVLRLVGGVLGTHLLPAAHPPGKPSPWRRGSPSRPAGPGGW